MVLFGQSGSICEKWLLSGKNGFSQAKAVVFGKVIVFRQKLLF